MSLASTGVKNMAIIDVYYQAEGVREIGHLEVDLDATFGSVKALVLDRHGLDADELVFLENTEEPLSDMLAVGDQADARGVKAHVHRCRHIEIKVTFNGETVQRRFGPSTTVARVKHWAAVKKFGMTEEEASEHALQIVGTHDRPSPGTHLGALTTCPACHLAFHLVPDERVNGDCDAESQRVMALPGERSFRADLAKAAFRLGEASTAGGSPPCLLEISWPFAQICVTAKDGREYYLRFNCEGYPQTLWTK